MILIFILITIKINNLLSIKPDPAQQNALMEIVSNKEIHTELTKTFVISKHFSQDNFISLLYYLGYLTISGTELDEIILKIPNKVIESVYIDYFRSMLDQEDSIDSKQYTRAMKQMLFEHKNSFFVELMEKIMASLNSRDYVNMNESHVKLAAFLITNGFSYVNAKTEYPVGKRFIDLVLLPHTISASTVVFEFRYCAHEAKYIKKKDYTEEVLKKRYKRQKSNWISINKQRNFRILIFLAGYLFSVMKPVFTIAHKKTALSIRFCILWFMAKYFKNYSNSVNCVNIDI